MSQLQEKHDKLVKFVNKTLKLFKSYIEYNQNMMLEFKSLQHMGLDLDLDICIDNFDSNLNEIDMIKDELQFEHSINGELSKHEDIQNDQYLKDFDELLNNTETDEYNQSDNYDNQNSNLPYQPLISEPNNFDYIREKLKNSQNPDSKPKLKSTKRKKKLICLECNKFFHSPSHLKIHQRIHSNERPYKCSMCEMSFTTSGNMKVHQRVHTGERPFQCNHCDMTFKLSHHLRDHQLSHNKELNQSNASFQCTSSGDT